MADDPDSLLYNLLVAEISGHRGALEESVKRYSLGIEQTDDPVVAKRAAKIMLFAKDYDASLKAVNRWLELKPKDLEAHQLATMISLRQGDLNEVVKNLNWLLEHIAKDTDQGFKIIGALLQREDDKKLGLAAMEMLLADHADEFEAQMAYARLAFNAGEFEKAKQAAGLAVEMDSSDAAAQVLLARSRIEAGDIELALNDLEKATQRFPDDQELRLNYARLLVSANRLESAIEEFETLISQSAGDSDLLYSIGLLSLEVKSYDAAEKYLKKLLTLGERKQEAWYYLGRLEEERKQYDKALDWLVRVDSGSLHPDAQMAVARVQGKLGEVDQARERYRQIRQDNPTLVVRAWLGESDMLRELKQDQASFDVLEQALREFPDNIDILYSHALAAERIDRIDLLEQDLKKVLEKEPDHAHALNALGYTLADKTDRLQEALGYIQQALELAPEDPAILDSMGWVQYRLGNLEESLKYLRRASLELHDAEVAAHLGEVLWVSGDQEAAMEVWKKALDKDPESEILLEVMQRLTP
jgi:tetratricopeptide (TPR) repeat protein